MSKVFKSCVGGMVAGVLALAFGGCASNLNPVAGVYTEFKMPAAATGSSGYSKTGTSTAEAILGFGHGDASIEAAAKDGDIRQIHHVDYQQTSVLWGLYWKQITYVYGN